MFDQVMRLAKPHISSRIRRQLELVRRVHHSPVDGLEVECWIDKKNSSLEPDIYFSGLPKEVKWATLKVRLGGRPLQAKFWIVNGRLFIIEYDSDIRKFSPNDPLVVESWTEHHSLEPTELVESKPDDDGNRFGHVVCCVSGRIVEADVNGHRISAALPGDWHDSEWRKHLDNSKAAWFNPDEEIPIIHAADKEWFELLRIGPDFLGLQAGSTDGGIFWITHENTVEPMGNTMTAAVNGLKWRL